MAKRKVLGQGLDALFGEKVRQVEEIALAKLRANPYQPRRNFDEEALLELSDSIKQDGVFQPIIVRKSSV
ncbi:MAG: ParB N-terminal domain-containing protein, partial [Lactobacillales bacterium]|nr:ParB N-terminal domain-containing protein [Lactobacillales bacterium]